MPTDASVLINQDVHVQKEHHNIQEGRPEGWSHLKEGKKTTRKEKERGKKEEEKKDRKTYTTKVKESILLMVYHLRASMRIGAPSESTAIWS